VVRNDTASAEEYVAPDQFREERSARFPADTVANEQSESPDGSERSNQTRIAPPAVLRRSERTRCLSSSDDEVGGSYGAIRAERAKASGAIQRSN